MSFIKYTKDNLIKVLPEKRSGMIFVEPDIFFKFHFHEAVILSDDIVDKLNPNWCENLELWDTTIDFRKDESDSMDKYKQCFKSIDFGTVPTFTDEILNNDPEEKIPFAFNKHKELYINLEFISALKNAGSIDIWYDYLMP